LHQWRHISACTLWTRWLQLLQKLTLVQATQMALTWLHILLVVGYTVDDSDGATCVADGLHPQQKCQIQAVSVMLLCIVSCEEADVNPGQTMACFSRALACCT
jgi:hypothetical protein